MKTTDTIATTLLVIGGLNWGLSAAYLAFRWLAQPRDATLAARAR